jgi:hypothetical protein
MFSRVDLRERYYGVETLFPPFVLPLFSFVLAAVWDTFEEVC